MLNLLDLYCGAGGCSEGYHRAGFNVIGVDHKPQKRYPFKFYQADVFEFLMDAERFHKLKINAIHASPPCQRDSIFTPPEKKHLHPDDIGKIRDHLNLLYLPYVIENVRGAYHKLINPIMLCGTMFGLRVQRHRFFECSPMLPSPMMTCDHSFKPVLITGVTRRKGVRRVENNAQECRDASGLHWMTRKEMDEAIPPAYTEWIGRELINIISQ